MLWNSNFQIDELFNKIKFTNLNYHYTLQGLNTITWNSNVNDGKVDLLFSSDLGKSWIKVDTSKPNTGNYDWNTNRFSDCSFGKLRIILKDDLGNPIGFNDSHLFTINNNENGKPFVELINLKNDTTINTSTVDLKL